MQCEEFEDRLQQAFDERKRPEWDAEWQLHCETCSVCRDVAAAYETLLEGFHALKMPEVPADMAARVLVDLRPRVSTARRVSFSVLALATAAGLLIAVVPLLRLGTRSGVDLAAVPSTHHSLAQAKATGLFSTGKSLDFSKLPIVPELLSIQNEAGGGDAPYEALVKETGQGLATLVLAVPGNGGARPPDDRQSHATEDEPTWIAQVSESFKPVTESVTETFNLLLRVVPFMASTHRS